MVRFFKADGTHFDCNVDGIPIFTVMVESYDRYEYLHTVEV